MHVSVIFININVNKRSYLIPTRRDVIWMSIIAFAVAVAVAVATEFDENPIDAYEKVNNSNTKIKNC